MLLDLESVRCFEAVAVLLNFRQAAQKLALSPAALSDRIRRLEEQLGESLLQRTTRKVALTTAGERLLPQARRLLQENARFLELARNRAEMPRVELLIGTRYDLGLSWLVPALVGLEKNRPGRILHLHFGEGPDLLDRLHHGLLDGAITSSPIVGGALDYLVLHPEDYVFVGAKRLLEQNPIKVPGDALRHRLLDLTPDLPLFRYFLDQTGDGVPWRFSQTQYLGTIGAVKLRVLQGKGVAVLPKYFVRGDLRQGHLKRILGRVAMRTEYFRLVWRRDHSKAEAIRQLGLELQRFPLR
jgi:LysR family transcriptional regulator, glycine cleavage system transcriptional activator